MEFTTDVRLLANDEIVPVPEHLSTNIIHEHKVITKRVGFSERFIAGSIYILCDQLRGDPALTPVLSRYRKWLPLLSNSQCPLTEGIRLDIIDLITIAFIMFPSKIEIGADGGFHDFPDLPPFPSDMPIAPLLRLSLKRLQDGDSKESARFIRAAKDLGFFYLDLRNSMEGEAILKDMDRLFKLGEYLSRLDLEEKQSYDFSGQGTYYGWADYQLAVFSLPIHTRIHGGYGPSF
ncbi:MAG: hypothetical protein Q9187_007997 [Circinaria calcarea]